MDVPKRRFNLRKISEYLQKVEEVRNKNNQQITNKTDAKKLVVPDHVTKAIKSSDSKKEPAPFVSKIRSKN